jgi:hypothetical protein
MGSGYMALMLSVKVFMMIQEALRTFGIDIEMVKGRPTGRGSRYEKTTAGIN